MVVGMINPLSLTGKTVLVTGASYGIGLATAVYLSRLGARIVLVGRRRETLEETQQRLQPIQTDSGEGIQNHVIATCDLSQTAEISNWMKSLSGENGALDGVVHCAGMHYLSPLQMLDLEKIDALMRVNYLAALMLTKGFRAPGVGKRPASIVWLSSVMGRVGQSAVAAYSGSKGALEAACRSVALELAREQIRVNCIAPGHTELGTTQRKQLRMTPEQYQHMIDMHPLGAGQPDDVAAAVAFLLSDSARWITGTTLVVDGGYSAR
jgi:NAD(P)-dependent dehydrogenase (short-subunit alcohol dehydrogenase family)